MVKGHKIQQGVITENSDKKAASSRKLGPCILLITYKGILPY